MITRGLNAAVFSFGEPAGKGATKCGPIVRLTSIQQDKGVGRHEELRRRYCQRCVTAPNALCLHGYRSGFSPLPLAGGPSTAFAQQSATSRFKTLDHSQAITSQRKPLSLLANERVKVVVTMSAQSVAEVRATAPGHVISQQDHDAIHGQIERQHAALEPTLVSRGGTVLAHYHDALNGHQGGDRSQVRSPASPIFRV